MRQVIATYHGLLRSDAFYFAPIINGTRVHGMIMDTGAFELTFSRRVADKLGLPNLGPVEIGGVGGSVKAYKSRCNIRMNNCRFPNTPCIVDSGLSEAGLFGLRFFVDNHLKLELDPSAQTLTIARA